MTLSEELAPVVECLRRTLGHQLVALVLFGSHARGDAGADSDWDILLIAEELPAGLLRRHSFLKRALPDEWRGRIALLAKTREEFERGFPSLYLDIGQDGLILHDPEGYAEQRLARIRQLASLARLRRERRGRSWAWRWEKVPLGDWRIDWDGVDGIES